MGEVRRFEDLEAWRKARILTRDVYEATPCGPWVRDHSLAVQIQRAAVSIMSNIAEGNERGTPSEYHHFLSIAKASCAEVRSQLYVALDIGDLDPARFQQMMAQTEEVRRIVGGLRAAIARKRISDVASSIRPSAEGLVPHPSSLIPEE